LKMGYDSMFTFCVEECDLSRSDAQRKIDAVSVAMAVPDLPEKLEKGEISFAKVTQVSRFMREEKREVDRSFTKKEVRDLVSMVQTQKNEYEAKKALSQRSEIKLKPIVETATVVSGGRTVLQIEVDQELMDLLEEVRLLTSHKGYQTKSEIIKTLARFYLEKKHPRHKKLVSRETKLTTENHLVDSSNKNQNPRFIPTWMKEK